MIRLSNARKCWGYCLFDSLVALRRNDNTKSQRKALTIVYNRPFMKQQIDLTKATKSHIRNKCNKKMLRLLGFNARVPSNIQEFDLPIEKDYINQIKDNIEIFI